MVNAMLVLYLHVIFIVCQVSSEVKIYELDNNYIIRMLSIIYFDDTIISIYAIYCVLLLDNR